jgi:hypothetical protein
MRAIHACSNGDATDDAILGAAGRRKKRNNRVGLVAVVAACIPLILATCRARSRYDARILALATSAKATITKLPESPVIAVTLGTSTARRPPRAAPTPSSHRLRFRGLSLPCDMREAVERTWVNLWINLNCRQKMM